MFEIDPHLSKSNQLITVKADDWNQPIAYMQRWERADDKHEWLAKNDPFEVVIGKNGMAWAYNLLPIPNNVEVFKKEGDMKTPAGLYGLCYVFGYAKNQDPGIKWPYLPLNENLVGVDDPDSLYYNCIIDQNKLKQDWNSAETMYRADGLYKWGLVIDFNFTNAIKAGGSQIFMHIWRGAGQGTEGCIALSEPKMMELLHWIDGNKNPLIWIH